MRRGDIYWSEAVPGGRRPVVVIARDAALAYLTSVNVAPITGRLRDIPSHVRVDERHGLRHESDINCDALATVPVATLTEPIGSLDAERQRALDEALRFALGLEAAR